MCDEFLSNICESQEQGRAFCYSWLLFIIEVVAWEAPAESVLPEITTDMCEGARYAHLWDSTDPQRLEENQVFWVLFQSNVAATINSRPQLYPVMYDRYKGIAAFQVTLQNV